MSGFLHQLAARSLGLTPDIRPRAALPYAAPPEDAVAGTDNPLATPASVPPSPTPLHEASASTFRLPPQPLAGQTTIVANDSRSPMQFAPDPLAATLLVAPSPQADRQPPHGAVTPPTADPERAPMPVPLAQALIGREAAPTALVPTTDQPVPPDSAPELPGVDLESLIARLSPPEHAAAPESPSAAPALTAPLSQPLAQAQTRPPRAALTQAPSPVAKTSPADAEPEVHITIGRLEVNPPPRPTPPPAPRPRGPAPLSLSDYLARRNGGRP